MSQDNCISCGKPLGNTIAKCHECGGKTYRGGKPIGPHEWQILLGVPADKLKNLNYDARKYGTDAWDEAH